MVQYFANKTLLHTEGKQVDDMLRELTGSYKKNSWDCLLE